MALPYREAEILTVAQIVRCPNCISLIYEGTEVCHHCGEKLNLKRKRIMSKGAGLFILLAVTAFAAGDAIYLAKERSKIRRFDRDHIEHFIDVQLLGDEDDDERLFECKNGTVTVPSLRAAFRQEVGDKPDLDHRRTSFRDHFDAIVRRHGRPREVEARRYTHYVDVREADGGSRSLPMTFEMTGSIRRLRIIRVTWHSPSKPPSGG